MAGEHTDRLTRAALAGDQITAQVISRSNQGYRVNLVDYNIEAWLSGQFVSALQGTALKDETILRVAVVAYSRSGGRTRVEVAAGLPWEHQQTLFHRVREEEQDVFEFLQEAVLEEGVWMTFRSPDSRQVDRAIRDSQLLPLIKEKRQFWNNISQCQSQNSVLCGCVLHPMQAKDGRRAGYLVALPLVKCVAFMPESQSCLPGDPIDFSDGSPADVHIIKIDPLRGSITISQRLVLEERRAARLEQLRGSLRRGVGFYGKVVRIMEHGAIIDIGGIRGYLPSRELAGPTEALTEGELREFVVKDFEENGQIRVTFSLRLPVEEHARFGYDEYHIQVWEQEQMGDAEPSITILETQTEKATAIDINDLVIIEGIETTE